ncbi:MAG: hypothetical protein NXI30_04630 [bacterium]|nr:hypothetical protein [bacterium]
MQEQVESGVDRVLAGRRPVERAQHTDEIVRSFQRRVIVEVARSRTSGAL